MARIASSVIVGALFGALVVVAAGEGFGSPQSGPVAHPEEPVGGATNMTTTSTAPPPSTSKSTVASLPPSSGHNSSSSPFAAALHGQPGQPGANYGSKMTAALSILLVVVTAPILL